MLLVESFCLFLLITSTRMYELKVSETETQPIIVETKVGKIRGDIIESDADGDHFYAFRGIRYAKAPVGELRFKAPEPVERWDGIFDATKDGPACPQQLRIIDVMSEDCLYLNVYAPEHPLNGTQNKRPVIFYIHGGGFYIGSGLSNKGAGPQYLMRTKEVVLVTFNYRLATLGFLSLGIKDYPGNAAHKDQVMALKWVRDNIESFGGDPNLVTIMGNSAGAMSVVLLMVSPMSKGLFHRAIMMSGCVSNKYHVPNEQIEIAKRQARVVNCTTESIDKMLSCLKQVSSKEWCDKMKMMFEFGYDNPISTWLSVIEPDLGQERFLLEDPFESIKNGRFEKVPILTGITEHEFATSAVTIIQNRTLLQQLNDEFETYGPIYFLYESGTELSRNISQEIKNFYFSGKAITEQSLVPLNHVFSDSINGFNIHQLVHLTANFTNVFYYMVTFKGRFSNLYYPHRKPYGVEHSDDILYLFDNPNITPIFSSRHPENKMVNYMTKLWTSFAKTGNPINPADEIVGNVVWKPVDNDHEHYLDIGDELILKENLLPERYNFWKRLYPV